MDKKIIERISRDIEKLSEHIKEGKFEVANGYFTVKFRKKLSDMN